MKKKGKTEFFLRAEKNDSILLSLYVQPKASRNRFLGAYGNALKLAVTAPPIDGKANKAVISFLAKFFGLAKSAVSIKSGHQGRHKQCLLEGISLQEVEQKVEGHL